MKRIGAFIFLIIVAVAAFTPCCMVDDCQDDITATSKADPGKTDGSGVCSPFFSCTTCPGFTSMEKTITIPIPGDYQPQYFVSDLDFICSTYVLTPWQPPRTV